MILKVLSSFILFTIINSLCVSAPDDIKTASLNGKIKPSLSIQLDASHNTGNSEKVYLFNASLENFYWNNRLVKLNATGKVLYGVAGQIVIDINSGDIGYGRDYHGGFTLYGTYKDGLLTISYLQSKILVLTGHVNLAKSAELDLELNIKGLSLQKLNSLLDAEDFPFQGNFRGRINLKGNIDGIYISGALQAYQGKLEDYPFQKVFLEFNGTYPVISLSDSYAVIENHNFITSGTFNLAELYNMPSVRKSDGQIFPIEDITISRKKNNGQIKLRAPKSFLAASKNPGSFVYQLGNQSYLKLDMRQDKGSRIEQKIRF